LRLLWKEEDERAGSGVGGWDIEVVDGTDIRSDGSVVLGSVRQVWRALGDGNDQVWVLVGTAEVGWADLAST